MPMDRFLIAPFDTGLQTDLRAWLIMDEAFAILQNAYVFRGRVRKRFGSLFMGTPPNQFNSRLRVSLAAGGAGIGITDVTGAGAGNIITITGDATLPLAVGEMFSIGSQIYTVVSAVAGPQAMLATQGSATFNITNGDFTFTGAPALTAIFFYPGLPVMGITQYESGAVNNHPSYAFDTNFAYLFSGGSWNRSGAAIWHGTNTNFFWTTNWQGSATAANSGTPVMFVTNFNATIGVPGATDDPIWYTPDGATWVALSGTAAFFFLPNGGAIHTGPYVKTARIIVPFKNRLLLLNTVENDNSGGAGVNTAYTNRVRYSFNGSPFARNAWYEPNQSDSSGGVLNNNNIAAGAGFIDATTEEQIISAEFIKDRLIVYFERSTWELAYTGNEILPFVWQKINTELGSQSTFSTVPFDKEILTIGNTGIHSCNGANVVRIDAKIPDEIFEFESKSNGNLRTAGIRDYFAECVYWTFVSALEEPTQTFPNQVLVYNYKNSSWSLNDDCFTAFGYFEQQDDTTWASSAPATWLQSSQTWNSGVIQANQRVIIAGTPEGFIVRIASDDNPGRNAPTMQLTNIVYNGDGTLNLTIINHNFDISGAAFGFTDYLLLENIVGDATTMSTLNGAIFPVFRIIDANTITIDTRLLFDLNGTLALLAGTYNGAGTVARVSNIQMLSKQYNPYTKEGRNVYVARIDFGVQKTVNGQITVDYYPSSTQVSMIAAGTASTSIMGNNILETYPYSATLYPLESFQERLWHPIYFQSDGECIQLAMYLNVTQMMTSKIALSDFELEGMVLHTSKTSVRLQ